MRILRAVPIVATAALALAGVVSVGGASLPAAAGPLNTSYMMKITNDPANTISNIDYDYLTYPGFDLFMYNNGYNGTFGDEHLSGITLTLNGQRIAGNGDIHLLPAVEQWDAAQPDNSTPLYAVSGGACAINSSLCGQPRQYDYTTNTITLPMKYVYDSLSSTDPLQPVPNVTNYPQMKYDLIAKPEPGGVNLKVVLRDDLPTQLEESASFMLEFIPSLYKQKSYSVDTDGDGAYDSFGTLPLAPEDPMDEDWPRADLKFSAWYVEQWNNEKGDQQPRALGRGYSWVLSPEDAQTRVTVTSDELLSVYDGRNRSQNGWFGMSSRIAKGSKAGQTVAEWHIQAPVQNNWTRPVSIAHSQAGYAPGLSKVAVMEIDSNDTNPPAQAKLWRLGADGEYTEAFSANVGPARQWTRFDYRDFDFSAVTAPGTYVIEYDGVRTDPFPISADVYTNTWQSGLSGFLATAMDHIEVREGYKIWHGASHMDDARIGEHFENSIVNPATNRIQWFDGQQVPMDLPAEVTARGYDLGDRILGLNQGGWFDAGDFDIQLSRNYNVLRDLVYNAEAYDNMRDYDTLAVEWSEETGGTVEMHRPDGVADIVQQIKHGAMQILANYEVVGIVQGTVEVPSLRQYTHLGEGSTDTDGHIYDPTLGEDEVVERIDPVDGELKVYSGVNDDRMLMFGSGTGLPSANLGTVSISLAGAAAVTKDDYPAFAAECLAAADEIWTAYGNNGSVTAAQRSNAFQTLVQLILATEGTPAQAAYLADLNTLFSANAPGTNPFTSFLPIHGNNSNYAAALLMDVMDAQTTPAFTRSDVVDAVVAGAAATYGPVAGTPFGFTESTTATWGPISGKLTSSQKAAILYETIGEVAGIQPLKDHILMAVNYIVGNHPYNDTSWLLGAGAKSHKYPYNSNRADEGFIPGSIVPGYINFKPDFPESLDNFSFLWAENEAIIDYPSRFMVAGLAADEIARQASSAAAAPSTDFSGSYVMDVVETPYTDYTGTGVYEKLATPGFEALMYNQTFSPIFGDQHTAGLELVLAGERVATNGDIHLLPTPEQWDATPAPILNGRSSDEAAGSVSATLTLPGVEGDATKPAVGYTMTATAEPGGFALRVDLDQPLPADLDDKAGFNLEFIPEVYKEKNYQVDHDGDGAYDTFGVIPLIPFDDMEVKDRARTQDQEWYVQEWNRDRGDYQPVPIATGKKIVLAPEDDSARIRVTSDDGDVQLLDGRNRAQNGWFVLRTEFGAGDQSLTWHIAADVEPGWARPASIGHSQAGYAPVQSKVAVLELDPAGSQPSTATVKRVNPDGTRTVVYTGPVGEAKRWLRYDYRDFDFTAVEEPGMYVIQYAGVTTDVFPIDAAAYAKSWQQTLSGFLAKEMDHIEVRDAYKINHAASHMDDALMWPLCGEPFRSEAAFDGAWFDGQDFCPTERTNTTYTSLEHIPGLAVGGWYDAGDYDLEATRQAGVIQDLAIAWREFAPSYDTMDVDWNEATGGYVELHRGDGVPDIVQQIRHGVLNVIARFEAIGYNFKVVEVPTLRQYTHLGDGGRETDNLIYDPTLAANETQGLRSGKQDDRLATVGVKETNLQFYGAYAMAAAAGALEGWDDELAAQALGWAEQVWETEDLILEPPTCAPGDFWCIFGSLGTMAAEFDAAIELALATGGEQQYLDAIEQLFPVMSTPIGWGASFASGGWKAVFVLDYMDAEFKAAFKDAAIAYKEAYDASVAANPWGVSDTTGLWGGSTDVVNMGETMYFMHKAFPDVFSSDYTLRAANYILGTHPDDDVSWVTGVGTSSVEKAYGNNRAEDFYIAGGIIPGYVPILPDLPEAKSGFGMMWFESEYVIDTAAKWVVVGNAANVLANQAPTDPPAPDPVDGAKTVLAAVVAGVAGLSAADYTQASWGVYQTALDAAQAALEPGSGASLADVQGAQAGLLAALSLLRPRDPDPVPDTSVADAKTVLAQTIATAGALDEADYTAASWRVFAQALSQARLAQANPLATAPAVQAANQALALAAGLLVPAATPAPTARDAAVTQVDALIAAGTGFVEGNYTAASWAAYQTALANARAAAADPASTAAQIAAVHSLLVTAIAGLTPPAPSTPGGPSPSPSPTASGPAPSPTGSVVPNVADPVKVKAPQTAIRLVKGKSATIPAWAYRADGTKAAVKWSTSNKKVATVSAKGKITAKKAGKATLTATSGKLTAKVKVTVVAKKPAAKVKKVTATVPKTLTVGQVAWITGKHTPATPTGVKITYSSNKPAVAAIDRAGRLQAVAAGTATITVKAGKIKKTYKVTVN